MTPEELQTPPTDAEVAGLLALCNAAGLKVAGVFRKLGFERYRLKADAERLNQMLRDNGYGQGAIDAYVAQCEELDKLRERNQKLIDWVKQLSDGAMDKSHTLRLLARIRREISQWENGAGT